MIQKRIPLGGAIVVSVLFLLLGAGGMYAFDMRNHGCESSLQFVNSAVVCGPGDVIRKTGYTETRNEILKFIDTEKRKGNVKEVAVYFRDLERGPVMGINEIIEFAPASLLKLPLAFVFMGVAEVEPRLLTHRVRFTGTTSVSQQRIPPIETALPDTDHEIESLLRMMLTYSDNASYEVLENYLAKAPERGALRYETFQELGLIDPKDRVEATITVRGYASLFRILYNASYLNSETSEKVLSWLAASSYTRGLVAGVPEGIQVAHKFGERMYPDGMKELHDCGIVYFPENPYLMCIMTRGYEWNALESVVSAISRMMYEEVDSRRL